MAKDLSAVHKEAMTRADEACIADFDNRREMLDDLRFRANEGGHGQWDPLVLRERIDAGRPVITINLIPQFVRQVTNDARNNRPAIKVRPVDDDADPETAEVFEGIIRHIEDQSEATSKAYIPGVDNAATCGVGHWRVKADYCDGSGFEQDLFIEGLPNALGVLYDPLAKDPTRSDGNYCFVVDDMTREEFEKKWPDATVSDFTASPNHAAMIWWNTDSVRVAEYWCKEPADKTLLRTRDGAILDITKVPKEAVKFLPPGETRTVKSHKIVQYTLSGQEVLDGPKEWPGQYIPIVPVIGEETFVGENRVRSGLVRHAKDPARLYNLWRSNQAEIIGLQPKAPFIATFKQIEKYRALWNEANKRNLPYLPYDADPQAPGPPHREQPPQPSPGMAQEISIAAGELRATTGIYDSGLGQHSSEAVSGRAIGALQKQSDLATLHFGDNLQLSIRHTGRILIDLIPFYYDTERTVRLLNEDGSSAFKKINSYVMTQGGPEPVHDLSIGKYDVTVTTGPSYATRRMEAADAMMQFIQTAPQSAAFMLDVIAKNMDWPGAEEIAERFRMELLKTHPELADQEKGEKPPPPSGADQQNALMAQLEAREKTAQARLAEAQADDAEMDAAIKGIQVEVESTVFQKTAEAAVAQILAKFAGQVQPPTAQPQQQPPQVQPGQGAGPAPAPVMPQPAQAPASAGAQ